MIKTKSLILKKNSKAEKFSKKSQNFVDSLRNELCIGVRYIIRILKINEFLFADI